MAREVRRFDLDWVRVSIVLLVFIYHCSLFFWTAWWYIKNTQTSAAIDIFIRILEIWMMPMLFMVAGCAAWFSLGSRKSRAFVKERFNRLLVPFIVGIVILIPPVTYLDRITRNMFSGSFFEYYPHFFQGWYSFSVPWKGDFNLAHLWFLLYLFVISLIALPLLLYLRSNRARKAIDGLARFTARPGAIYLYAIPGCLFLSTLLPIFPHNFALINDWAYLLCVLFLFIYGYIFCMDGRFWDAVERHKSWSLGMALIATAIWIFFWIAGIDTATRYSLAQLPFPCLYAATTWFCLLAILGYARRYLNFSNRFLAYANEAALPFYVLHVTVVVIVGFFVVQWNIGLWAKYLLLISISFPVIVLIYEFIIKRVNVIRLLFGMRPKLKTAKYPLVKNPG